MDISKIILGIYGILLFAGAFFGWRAGSKISLIMGILSGILVFIGIYLTNTSVVFGYRVLTGVSGVLSVIFLLRFIKTQTFMPSGMLLLLSVVALVVSVGQLLKH